MTSTQPPAAHEQVCRIGHLFRELWFQVVIGAVLGIAVGLLCRPSVSRSNRSTTGSSPW